MAAIFEPLFTKLKLNLNYLPVSAFEPVAQEKLRLKPFVKSLKAEPMGSRKMLQ